MSTFSRRCNNNKHQYRNVHAHHLFDKTPHGDLYSLNSLIASYVRNNDPLTAWNLFVHIHRIRSDLNAYTFTPVLGACSSLSNSNRGQQVHGLMIKLGSDSGIVTETALIDMYSKYGQLGDSFMSLMTWVSRMWLLGTQCYRAFCAMVSL
ncbi:unnamed protein product [Camellia sinensis]